MAKFDIKKMLSFNNLCNIITIILLIIIILKLLKIKIPLIEKLKVEGESD